MNDELCSKFVLLRNYLPDNLRETPSGFFNDSTSLKNYCDNGECNTEFDKIKAGFLWLLAQNCSISQKENYNENNFNSFFLHIISWLSYKLNQKSEYYFTTINDFYTKHINDNEKYTSLIKNGNNYTKFKEIIDKRKNFLEINIYDMAKFYDAFKFLCSMYDNAETHAYEKMVDNAVHFVNKYTDLNDYYNVEGTTHSQILSTLSTNYNNFKAQYSSKITSSKQFPNLPTGRATKSFLRNSSIKISVIPMVFIFFGLLIYLGIVYKVNNNPNKNIIFKIYIITTKLTFIFYYFYISASKTQFKNQKNKEENKSLICGSKSSDYFRNSNND
ncbi:putative yir2 protein [Plasmodium yoelii yoelii]|uniref:Yir2 protein n=1 Tax=Plasmodium yoelii yoelii TaxID=73239 RepID=Q7RCJ0_PLAYO|nr:putative yir2 protein [Plasmodium yoelii yoelii]